MKYPYMLYRREIEHAPVFENLDGPPFVMDLSYKNRRLRNMDVRNQRQFQAALERAMAPDHSWGLSGYLERRDSLLRDCPQMVEEGRFFHLGLDIIVPQGADLHAPLKAKVADAGYEEGDGNYGGWALLEHVGDFQTFYSFYGHLCRNVLPEKDIVLQAGDEFAKTGDFEENGNWFFHTHLQIITKLGLEKGYIAKGYCAEKNLAEINDLCPSPLSLFKV